MKLKPNHLTFVRIVLAGLTFIFLINTSWVLRLCALFVFTLAALTDLWDGRLARATGQITNAGKILDPLADKILFLGTMITMSYLGLYPFWAILPIVAREVLVTVLRFYLLTKNVVVAAEKSGKIKVVSQIISLFVTFLCLLDRDYLGLAGPFLFFLSYLFLAVATWLTLASGWDFLKNNWKHLHA